MSGLTGPVAVRVFPGHANQAAEARRWVRVQAHAAGKLAHAPGELAADDAALVLTELFANAIKHTRSGDKGGTVTVAVTADGTIHVHDLGTTGQPPCLTLATTPAGLRLLELTGRGLPIVAALCPDHAAMPAAQCAVAGPGDPAAHAGGCCISCRPESWPDASAVAGARAARAS